MTEDILNSLSFYGYCVTYWDEIEEEMTTSIGVICATDLKDLGGLLSSWYGNDNIDSVKIRTVGVLGDRVLDFKDDVQTSFFKGLDEVEWKEKNHAEKGESAEENDI